MCCFLCQSLEFGWRPVLDGVVNPYDRGLEAQGLKLSGCRVREFGGGHQTARDATLVQRFDVMQTA